MSARTNYSRDITTNVSQLKHVKTTNHGQFPHIHDYHSTIMLHRV